LIQGRTKIVGRVKPTKGHTFKEIIQALWKAIDEAKMYLEDPLLTPEEKRRWAKTLADTIGVLNKVLASQGEKQLEDEDLGSLLTKVPRPLRAVIRERVYDWRGKSS